MTPELLASVAAILLSLLFSYIPGFTTWYEPLPGDVKRLVMLALLCLTALASFTLACAHVPLTDINLSCDTPGAIGLMKTLWVVSGLSITGRQMVTLPHRLLFPCSMQVC